MSFKKLIILIFVCCLSLYLLYEERGFFTQTFKNINFNILSASLTEDYVLEEETKTIRIYNAHPSGEAIALKKDTKLLSKKDGVVYQTKETVVVPGIKNGEPGEVDVSVNVYKNTDEPLSTESVISIPGLSSTDYFKTTWAEIVDETKEEEVKSSETLVSGIIEKDSIWEVKNSPYVIYGNIFIPKDVTLIIEPGVEIIITGDYSFLIEGEIKMTGERKTPVTFFRSN
ncbi:MAG: hypothetical protein PHF88_01665 [Candidatus Pacebacteria bacterium]|nr:hypothetical protein [Candidatus Paceibacterota bacterium]